MSGSGEVIMWGVFENLSVCGHGVEAKVGEGVAILHGS